MKINNQLIQQLLEQAALSPRLRQNFDMRTSEQDVSQRMLNAIVPGSKIPIHRHPISNENVFLICGRLDEVIYDSDGKEIDRISLDASQCNFGYVMPAGTWHTVEVFEPSVIYEEKNGQYKQDGTETLEEYKAKLSK